METPLGYAPGVTSQQAQQAAIDRPISRADQPKTAKQIRELIESKRVLIKSIQHASDPDYFAREESRLLREIEQAQTKLEALRLNKVNGAERVAWVEASIAQLEQELKQTENAAVIDQTRELMKMLLSLGVELPK